MATLSQANACARALDTVLMSLTILLASAVVTDNAGGVESQHNAGGNCVHIHYLHKLVCGKDRKRWFVIYIQEGSPVSFDAEGRYRGCMTDPDNLHGVVCVTPIKRGYYSILTEWIKVV